MVLPVKGLARALGFGLAVLFIAVLASPPALGQEVPRGNDPAAAAAGQSMGRGDSSAGSGIAGEAHAAGEADEHAGGVAQHEEAEGDHGGTHGHGHGAHEEVGQHLPLWTVIPFAGILLSIALGPLLAPKFWHHHFPKVSAFWALVFAVPFVLVFKSVAVHEILHIYLVDYIPFIVLLWSLFTASGGILLRGTPAGTPKVNLLFLVIGTLLASWIGTTGASMLLIRPMIRANAKRRVKMHIVIFFIFLVSNIGGSLTPLGDPPLFLGFLHSVPFFWTFNLLPHMGFVAGSLLVIFFIADWMLYRRERDSIGAAAPKEPLRLEGAHNFLFLLGILGGVLLSGMWRPCEVNILGVEVGIQNMTRDGILVLMGLLSLATTKKRTREDNEFTWFPIKEVAYLFAGIFMTIIPALAILRAGENGALAWLLRSIEKPAHYFWITGGLSSFLDNAPTYLTFFNSALGKFFQGMPEREAVAALIQHQSVYLKAIATGAVFMGANTYIGNAPNFMVRSIAEEQGIRMPSFFGYMVKFSIPILIPLFMLVTLIFFS